MHLVLASSLVPCGTPESGFEIANAAITEGLRRAGVRVSHLGFQWPDTDLSEPAATVCLGAIDVKTANATRGQQIAWLLAALRHGLPFASAKLRIVPDDMVSAALSKLRPFDGVIVNGTALAGAFERVLTEKAYLYVAHNVEYQSASDAADHAAGVFERLMYRREARHLKALETRLIEGAAHVLLLSGEDRNALGLGGDERASVVPLVTPLSSGDTKGQRVPVFDIGLIGSWTWAPNRIGLEWFLQHVVPHLPKTATVAVAGNLPADFPQRDARVRFLGRVLDAKQFLRQCRVVALTARAGTGVQLKTIEAFELGLPVVATPASLRGIAAAPDNARIAAEPADYARALAETITGHRTGAVTDLDGSDFRAEQIAGMDLALANALRALPGSS